MRFNLDRAAAFWWTLGLVSLWRVVLAFRLDIIFDEGHYFYWSLHPQLSYFDHPPLTAWAIAGARTVFGDGILSVRFWPLLVGALLPLIGRSFARDAFSDATGNRAGILLTLCPVFAGAGLFMTPDTLLMLFWAISVWATWRALDRHFGWWWVAGASAGLGMLSKYSMVLYFAGLALLFVTLAERRGEIFRGALLASVLALVLFTPVVVWNVDSDWISFRYQLGHGLGAEGSPGVLQTFPDFLGGLLLVATPLLGGWALWAGARDLRSGSPARRYCGAFVWCVVVVFGLAALRSRGEANWSMAAFFTGLVAVAADWPAARRGLRLATFGLLAGITLLAFSYLSVPRASGLNVGRTSLDVERLEEAYGGAELAAAVRGAFAAGDVDFIATEQEMLLGEIAFYAPELRPLLVVTGERAVRLPWIEHDRWRGRDALLVSAGEGSWEWFADTEPLSEEALPVRGQRTRRIVLSLGIGYQPTE